MRLLDKVVMLTGGGRGIGRTICLTMAREGANVAVIDLDLASAQSTAAEVCAMGRRAIALKADVTKKDQVQAVVAETVREFGRLDVLFNNVGILAVVSVLEMSEETWDRVMTVNTRGVFLCSQAVLPVMIEQGGGKIINMASQAGKEGSALTSAYASSKHAIIGFTQSLAKEVGRHNITVNAVCPGSVDTEMLDDIYFPIKAQYAGKTVDAYREDLVRSIPLRRLARAEEVGYLAVFLASNEADYITGAALNVTGGSLVH